MDKREVMLQRMVRRVRQAAQGTGEALKVLRRFGLDAKELVKLDTSTQFDLIGQRINAITNSVERLAAAVVLFDIEGISWIEEKRSRRPQR